MRSLGTVSSRCAKTSLTRKRTSDTITFPTSSVVVSAVKLPNVSRRVWSPDSLCTTAVEALEPVALRPVLVLHPMLRALTVPSLGIELMRAVLGRHDCGYHHGSAS